jgi:SAM-dependent methyltransferase
VREDPKHIVHHCDHCGTEFLDPQPSDADLSGLYSESYYQAWGLQDPDQAIALEAMKIMTFNLRLGLIGQFRPKGTVLDVGCATGFFLKAATAAGYSAYGVEFSPFSAGVAQGRFGKDRVFQGILEDCPFAPGSFDVITLSDLLEHVRDPLKVLGAARRLLKEDGILMIMTPATDSLSRWFMGRRWVHYKTEHLFYFNRPSMRALAESGGFQVAHLQPAAKYINLAYVASQFTAYPHWLITPLVQALRKVVPDRLAGKNFSFTLGEMVTVLRKGPCPQ